MCVQCDDAFSTRSLSGMLEKVGVALIDFNFFVLNSPFATQLTTPPMQSLSMSSINFFLSNDASANP